MWNSFRDYTVDCRQLWKLFKNWWILMSCANNERRLLSFSKLCMPSSPAAEFVAWSSVGNILEPPVLTREFVFTEINRYASSVYAKYFFLSGIISQQQVKKERPRRAAAIAKTIWRLGVQKAFKISPAISFQTFASYLAFKKLSKFYQRLAFKILRTS